MAIAVWMMQKVLARTTEQGARQFVYAALGKPVDPEALHGQYLNIQEVEEPSDYVIGDAGKARQDKLWVRSLACLKQCLNSLLYATRAERPHSGALQGRHSCRGYRATVQVTRRQLGSTEFKSSSLGAQCKLHRIGSRHFYRWCCPQSL